MRGRRERTGPGDGCGAPTADDLDYHLSTLFPPVRPRGHLELRMIDAQPGDGWIVPLAVSSALLSDAAGRRGRARRRRAAVGRAAGWPRGRGSRTGPWRARRARLGPADPAIAGPAGSVSPPRGKPLTGWRVPAAITAAVDAFIDHT